MNRSRYILVPAISMVRTPPDLGEGEVDVVRGQQHGVPAQLEFHPRLEREDSQRTGRVARERDASWAAGDAEDECSMVAEQTLGAARGLLDRHRSLLPSFHSIA